MGKVIFGTVWCVVFFVANSLLLGIVVGVVYSKDHPELKRMPPKVAYEMGYQHGAEAGRRYAPLLVGAAVTMAVAGSGFGVLPGTGGGRGPSY